MNEKKFKFDEAWMKEAAATATPLSAEEKEKGLCVRTVWRQRPDGKYECGFAVNDITQLLPGVFETEVEARRALTLLEKKMMEHDPAFEVRYMDREGE